jgi:hypothetical protein
MRKITRFLIEILSDLDSNTPRGQFKGRLRWCVALIIVSFFIFWPIQNLIKGDLFLQLCLYAVVVIGILTGIVQLTQRIPVRCTRDNCRETIYSDLPWLCPCSKENYKTRPFSFLYQCEFCNNAPLGFLCNKCKEVIPLGSEQVGVENKHCAESIPLEGTSVSVEDLEKKITEPKVKPPKHIFDNLDEAGVEIDRLKKFKDKQKIFENTNTNKVNEPATERDKINKRWRERRDKRTTLHEFEAEEMLRIEREIKDDHKKKLVLNDLKDFINEEKKKQY